MEATLTLVDVDPDIVDQAVGRPARVARANPGQPRVEVRKHFLQTHVAVAVEVREMNVFEYLPRLEDLHVQQSTGSIVDLVVRLAGFQYSGVDLSGGDPRFEEQVLGEPRLEELAARQAGDDERDTPLSSELHAQGVNGLETAVADIGMSFQAVNEDLVHRRCRAEHVVDTQRGGDTSDVVLGLVGYVAVVKGEGQRLGTHIHDPGKGVSAVLATAKQGDAVEIRSAHFAGSIENFFQVGHRLEEVGVGPLPIVLERPARSADARFVKLGPRMIVWKPAAKTVERGRRLRAHTTSDDRSDGGYDIGVAGDGRFDLSELNTCAKHLHLVVLSPQVLDGPVLTHSGQVAGVVEKVVAHLRKESKLLGRQLWAIEVAVAERCSCDPKMSGDIERKHLLEVAEHDARHVLNWPPDRNGANPIGIG